MVSSSATTVEEYLGELPDDRRDAIAEVRSVILGNLPDGYVETMNWGMIAYEIPLERYPDTDNGQPLGCAALASQKNYMSLYLWGVYGDEASAASFRERYAATGKRIDMGKSCVRFTRVDDLPLDVIAEAIAATPVDQLIAWYEQRLPGRA
jgi:hypothetical protein